MGTAEAEIVGFDFGLEAAFEGGLDYWEEALRGSGATGDGSSEEGHAAGGLSGKDEAGQRKTEPKNPALHFYGQFCYSNKSVSSRRRVSWEASQEV